MQRLFRQVLPLPEALKPLIVPRLAASRAKKVGPNYQAIGWSPIIPETGRQMSALIDALGEGAPPTAMGMMFSEPSVQDALRELKTQGVDRIVALAMFPHFSLETTVPAFQRVSDGLVAMGEPDLPVHYLPPFYDHPLYIQSLVNTIKRGLQNLPGEGPVHLLFSAHGLPQYVVNKGDPYPDQIRETVRRVITTLEWADPVDLSWQSRVGPTRWLAPSTTEMVSDLGKRGVQRLLFVPVSFVGEHIETLHEIDIELSEHARSAGIPHVGRAPALGLDADFIACLADLTRSALKRFEHYQCVRCLLPKPAEHRRQKTCPNCRFSTPAYLSRGNAFLAH